MSYSFNRRTDGRDCVELLLLSRTYLTVVVSESSSVAVAETSVSETSVSETGVAVSETVAVAVVSISLGLSLGLPLAVDVSKTSVSETGIAEGRGGKGVGSKGGSNSVKGSHGR